METAHALSRRGCSGGWSLAEHRGLTRLNITAKAGGVKWRQIHLPIPWHFENAKKIGDAICRIYEDFSSGIEPEQAAKKIDFSSPEEGNSGAAVDKTGNAVQQTDWNQLVERYREHKIRSGEIKPLT